jgi:hypothetical protein
MLKMFHWIATLPNRVKPFWYRICQYDPAILAQLQEDAPTVPKFQGSNPASAGFSRKL